MILTTGSIDYFGGDVEDGHYNSVSSAEACQQDCQVDRYCNLSSNNDDPQWKTITCHTFVTSRGRYQILGKTSRKKAAVLLDFVQMRGEGEGPAQIFGTFS